MQTGYTKNKILEVVSESDYAKGRRYPRYYIEYKGYKQLNDLVKFSFQVESQSSYKYYSVNINLTKNSSKLTASCTCPQFASFHSCKHVAGCLHYYVEEILDFNPEAVIKRKSLSILNSFQNNTKKVGSVKSELKLEVILDFDYSRDLELKLKIGKDKTYLLKGTRLGELLTSYKNDGEAVLFGKNFTYSPQQHYFNKVDTEIINYLYDFFSENSYLMYARCSEIDFDGRSGKEFLKLLKNKDFTVVGYGIFHGIKEENPFEPKISKQDNNYIFDLNINEEKFIPLTDDYEYFLKDGYCYHVTNNFIKLLKKMQESSLNNLVFEEKDLPTFSRNIVPLVKEQIIVDDSVDNLVIAKKPTCKLYFDIYYNDIVGNIHLFYGDKEIDYFEDTSTIVRDIDEENNIVRDILEQGFVIDNKKFILGEMEAIGTFLEDGLEELAQKYDIYTSEKIKKTNIIKNSHVTSTFAIGSDNIMNFSFELGEITNKELDNIFDSLRQKKKYFKLKSGDILNLEDNQELKQLEELAADLQLSSKDLAAGSGEIPKYRAIYLDSLKKNKYHIIKTNNLFDEFIENFHNFKNQKLSLTKDEKKVLRDYQITGVEWLYNIYKCDLGAILADEMGLGKSIQAIYFFKKILEEDKTARFLIVSPTSLVYNWEEEFEKFAPTVRYETLAMPREKRRALIKESDASVYITSYGLLREDLELYEEINFKVCIIDEAQNIKNPTAGITKAVKKIKAHTKIALTGTPIENSIIELWSIFDYIMPGFFSSQQNFNSKYKVKDFDEETNNLLLRLNKQIDPFILRRKKQDVLKDLPEKIENNIYIDLSSEQKKIYASEVKRVREEMDNLISTQGFMKARFMILQLLTRLRQLCIDPRLVFENYKGESTKIENLIKIVKELIDNGHKTLLFSSFKSSFELIKEEFDKNDISYYEINGSVSSKKRMELVTKFNQDETNVFLITLKAGGTGLNLTGADTVIHLDLWWNPQAENQATDRAHRIGQKNKVSIIKLIAKGTIEEKILELQEKKKMLSEKIIEGDTKSKNSLGELSEKDLQNLLAIEQDDSN